MPDYRWRVLEEARSALAESLRAEGVIRVDYVAAFPDQARFAVWLGTATDVEASRLRAAPTTLAQVHDRLLARGFVEQDLHGLGIVVLSQETVDREYDGSWFNAQR